MDELSSLVEVVSDYHPLVQGVGLVGVASLAIGGIYGSGRGLEYISTYHALCEAHDEGKFSVKPSFFRVNQQVALYEQELLSKKKSL